MSGVPTLGHLYPLRGLMPAVSLRQLRFDVLAKAVEQVVMNYPVAVRFHTLAALSCILGCCQLTFQGYSLNIRLTTRVCYLSVLPARRLGPAACLSGETGFEWFAPTRRGRASSRSPPASVLEIG